MGKNTKERERLRIQRNSRKEKERIDGKIAKNENSKDSKDTKQKKIRQRRENRKIKLANKVTKEEVCLRKGFL